MRRPYLLVGQVVGVHDVLVRKLLPSEVLARSDAGVAVDDRRVIVAAKNDRALESERLD